VRYNVRRYAASIHGTVKSLDGQIALADVLALEAIRVFLPDVFSLLHASSDALTTTSGSVYGKHDDSNRLKPLVDGLLAAASGYEEILTSAVRRLFPAAERHIGGSHYGPEWKGTWLRGRRVAHEDILKLYLERVAGEKLQAFTAAEKAWSLMTDREAFEHYLRSLEPSSLEDVVASLEAFEDDYTPEHVVPGAVSLLNVLQLLPERQRGMFDLPPRFAVSRVVYRLLRRLPPPEAEEAVKRILPQVDSLAARQMVIDIVGYRENAGHKLVSEEAAARFERAWRVEVRKRAASASDLAQEPDLLRVLYRAKREATAEEPDLVLPDDPL